MFSQWTVVKRLCYVRVSDQVDLVVPDFGDLHWVVAPFQTQIARLGRLPYGSVNLYTLQTVSKERGRGGNCLFSPNSVTRGSYGQG